MGKPRDLANVVATGNILADGAVAPAELTGVTATASELNILDGVTATATELNLMDGVTATTAELNHVDGVTSNVQTQIDTKAPVASPTFTGTVTGPTINASTALQRGGVAVTATAAELNKMDGVTVSASDINSVTAKAPAASPTFTGDAVFDTSTLKVDSSNNRVGVGTASPLRSLHVAGAGDTGIMLQTTDATDDKEIWEIQVGEDAGSLANLIFRTRTNNGTGGSEAMRLDNTGTLLFGKTADTQNDAGHVMFGNGAAYATRSGGFTYLFNRTSSDGELLRFQKDSSTIGSIDTVNGNIKVSAYGEEYASLSGTSVTVDCRSGNNFALTTSGNTTFTFSNVPTSGTAFGFTLKLTSGGSHTITYPNSVDFAGGTAPDAPASGETDILVFYTVDGGTNWYGALAIDAAG